MTRIAVYLPRVSAILGFVLTVIWAFHSETAAYRIQLIAGAWAGGLVLMALAEIIDQLDARSDREGQSPPAP